MNDYTHEITEKTWNWQRQPDKPNDIYMKLIIVLKCVPNCRHKLTGTVIDANREDYIYHCENNCGAKIFARWHNGNRL